MQQIPAQYGFQGDINQQPGQMNIQPVQMAQMQGYPQQIQAQQVPQGQQPQLMGQQVIGQIPQNMAVGMSVQPMK